MDDRFRLLMVDDNPDDRFLIRRALTREFPDLEIVEVSDPPTLERALEAGPYDLVITACYELLVKPVNSLRPAPLGGPIE